MIDWSEMRPKRPPTRKERGRYQRWVRYLKDSRLTEEDIHQRAANFAEKGWEPDGNK
jgi:hypothetical protein